MKLTVTAGWWIIILYLVNKLMTMDNYYSMFYHPSHKQRRRLIASSLLAIRPYLKQK